MQAHTSERSRHLVLRAEEGDVLPRALLRALEEHGIGCGWLRGGGVLEDVELRTYGERARTRHLRGPLQVVSLEGSIGLLAGRPSAGLRAVLVYETDRGVETVAGEIANARIVSLEVIVTAFDDLKLTRELDEASGTWMIAKQAAAPAPARAPARAETKEPEAAEPAPVVEAATGWGAAIAASEAKELEAPVTPARGGLSTGDIFARPRAGDFVEHFAFGRCEVLKADGDRIKIKVPKDGRIREISLAALRITPIEGHGPRRSFRLSRQAE